ncbi:MAG: TolC family protein [Myxococcales bacterium]
MGRSRRNFGIPLFAGCFSIAALCGVEGPAFADSPPAEASASALPRIGLREAIERSVAHNPDTRVALEQVRRAEALVTQVRSLWLPSISANGSYTRLDHNRVILGAPAMGTMEAVPSRTLQNADQLSGNLQGNVPLFAPARWVQTKQSKNNVESYRMDVVEVRRQVALATAHAYVAVMAQRRVIDVNQRALQNAKDHYVYAHTRFEGGIGNQLDDTRALREVESNRASLEQSLAALLQAQEALGVLVGADGPLDAEDAFVLPEVTSGEVARDSETPPERGDVLASRARLHAAHVVVKDRWADYTPTVNGQFMPFYNNPSTPTQPRTGWQAQILVTIPLFNGGFRIGLNREREALLAQTRAQLEAVARQAKSDVRVAVNDVQHADAAYLAATRAAELGQEALKMANIAYEAGATTNIEVIDAERRARDDETAMVVAEDAARRARLDLLSATGNLP